MLDVYGFEVKRAVKKDTSFVRLDWDLVEHEGHHIYNRHHFRKWINAVFAIHDDAEYERIDLLRKNRQYFVHYRVNNTNYFINVSKHTVHRGNPRTKSFPVINDHHQEELDVMCLYLMDIIDRSKDDRGRRWSLDPPPPRPQ